MGISVALENYECGAALICLGQENSWKFDWDDANSAHVARHDVSRDEVEDAFGNGLMELDYEEVNGEPRWTSLGHTNDLRVIVVVWTVRADAARAITARPVPSSGTRGYWAKRQASE